MLFARLGEVGLEIVGGIQVGDYRVGTTWPASTSVGKCMPQTSRLSSYSCARS